MKLPSWAPKNLDSFFETIELKEVDKNTFLHLDETNKLTRHNCEKKPDKYNFRNDLSLYPNEKKIIIQLLTNANMQDVWNTLIPRFNKHEIFTPELFILYVAVMFKSWSIADKRKSGEVKAKRKLAIKKIRDAVQAIRECDEPKNTEFDWLKAEGERLEYRLGAWGPRNFLRTKLGEHGFIEPPIYALESIAIELEGSLDSIPVAVARPGAKNAPRTYYIKKLSGFMIGVFLQPYDGLVANILNSILRDELANLDESLVRHTRSR